MKKIKIYFLPLVALIIALPNALKAQMLDDLKANVNNYKKQVVTEKLYVHLNKTFFLTGEILWFKVYNVEASSHVPLNLSKIAYVELLDNNNVPLLQTKVELKDGQGDGSIFLPASVTNGSYKFRAYTAWMKNFGPETFFEKPLTIVNIAQQPEKLQTTPTDFDVQFMPEGGNLVEGLNNKVAVKVTGSNGKGILYAGAIVDQNNDTVARFSPYKMGIGAFNFTPATGKTYKAIVKTNGKTVNNALPKINTSGYVFHAEDKGAAWDITVNSKNTGTNERLYLLVHNSAAVQFATEIVMAENASHYAIDKSKLADGVNQITLFNAQRQPVCERLVFKRPVQMLKINAKTDASAYEKRQKVSVDINASDEALKPQAATMSMSVYKVDSLQNIDNAGINSYLWLAADVKGFIESPEYYFDNNNHETNTALDNLLLAQGWRAFNWADATSSKKMAFQFLPEYAGEMLYGTVKDRKSGTAVPNALAYLTVPGAKARLFAARSDAQGRFFVNSGLVYGANEAVLQTNYAIDSTSYKIDLASPFFDKYTNNKLSAFNITPSQKQLLADYSLSMQVLNNYQATAMRQFNSPQTDSISFYGQPAKTFVLDQFTRFTTTEEVLREFVSYIFLVKKDKKLSVKMFNQQGVLNDEPLIMVDGVPLFDNNKIFELDPLKIKRVDVQPERVFNGPAIFEGVLSFVTYKGDMNGFELNPKAILIDYEGLQLQRQFYSPVYDTADQKGSRLPDFRNALYWNPKVITQADGKTNFEYYTSDMPGKYVGVLQGISNNGRSGSAYLYFEVK
ncbi:porin family protein [Mucilaginibacter auburnensis]|uniref:MG2 domain-containing protein n=1 Tax=Mucilaginibacter auburnensis TaxID=1457233 RepID=A0A2H9VVM9_9SPHI|nr:hypothetical protein [Mucilaginibacter auburnensis]PJJ84893.1 hypothetical protein CLV57_1915 [Mucilaginibacter auburnensis]